MLIRKMKYTGNKNILSTLNVIVNLEDNLLSKIFTEWLTIVTLHWT